MWIGRYGAQPWRDLEELSLATLERRALALGYLLEEEAPSPSPTGR